MCGVAKTLQGYQKLFTVLFQLKFSTTVTIYNQVYLSLDVSGPGRGKGMGGGGGAGVFNFPLPVSFSPGSRFDFIMLFLLQNIWCKHFSKFLLVPATLGILRATRPRLSPLP